MARLCKALTRDRLADGSASLAAQCRPWLEWAAAQIAASLTGGTEASGQLLAALDAILRSVQPHTAVGLVAGGDARRANDLAQQVAAVVIAVQSQDRLVQQLTHVAETLHALHEHLGDARGAISPESWRLLRDGRLRAFSMADERELFTRIVPGAKELSA